MVYHMAGAHYMSDGDEVEDKLPITWHVHAI